MTGKILHVTTAHGPYDTRIFEKEARSLAAAGYDVSLATSVGSPTEVDDVKLLPLGSMSKQNSRLQRLPRNLRALRYMLGKFDIIHIHDPELLLNAGICILLGRRVVFDVHEFYHETIRTSHWLPSVLRPVAGAAFAFVERTLLPRMAGVVVVRPEMMTYYATHARAGRVVMVRNFPNIDAGRIAAARTSARPLANRYIIHTGGVSRSRAFDVMVSAAERLRELGHAEPIINIGSVDLSAYSRPDRAGLLKRAEAAGVQVLGKVEFAESLRWIAHASIGYMPLAVSENNARGMPQKMFEYFRFALPVVACAFGTVQAALQECHAGLLVDPHDPQAHARAFAELLSDDATYRTLAEASEKAGQTYSFDGELTALKSLYEVILEDSRRSGAPASG